MLPMMVAASPNIEGPLQVGELGLAALLSAVIGLEREVRQKSAGLRTHVLVGLGAALFMLISKYGFSDVVRTGQIVVDPSRVAAQIVSGIGFIGAGVIFVRSDAVRGLTTAASIWLTAAVGAAAGAGLGVLAAVSVAFYLMIAVVVGHLTPRLPHSSTAISVMRVRYVDGEGVLRRVLETATKRDFAVEQVATDTHPSKNGDGRRPMVEVTLHLHGRGSVNDLAVALSEVDHVDAVTAEDVNVGTE